MDSGTYQLTIFWGYTFGIPNDWLVFGVFGVVIAIIVITTLVYFFAGGDDSPVTEELGLLIPEDEHGTIQTGQLIGKLTRTEDTLVGDIPGWQDEDGNIYSFDIPMNQAVPLPFFDVGGVLKRLWLILDRGDLSLLSFATLIHGLPKRWDLPYADRRKAGKFLVGRYGASSLTNLLTSKTGIATMAGLILGGMGLCFFLITVTGHLG